MEQVTKDKARKRAARELARRRDVPYVRALREITEGREDDMTVRPEDAARRDTPT